jgi:hypothetical protein
MLPMPRNALCNTALVLGICDRSLQYAGAKNRLLILPDFSWFLLTWYASFELVA